MKKEFVIIRNSEVKSLYDVVCVDYATENVDFMTKAVDFEEAQKILDLCDTMSTYSCDTLETA